MRAGTGPTRRAGRSAGCGAGREAERGAATAELALVLPLLVAVTVGLVWLLAVGAAQIRAVDAARETARAVARGDSVEAALARGERIAPPGGSVRVGVEGDQVVAVVEGRVAGPGGLLAHLPSVAVHAEGVAALEEGALAEGVP